uniref:Microtubule-associated proteins 1A/1B light chain 3C n=1 Tax=Strix occidentalis caurina TaxID=311401 RepID=A0A8D0L049_STROC
MLLCLSAHPRVQKHLRRGGRDSKTLMQKPQHLLHLVVVVVTELIMTNPNHIAGIRAKFPTKIPVNLCFVIGKKYLPLLDKTKFLVPEELTMTQFITIIRSRMALTATQAFYLLVNNKSLASMSLTMAEVYRDYKDEDGFVYMTYASQEMFGCFVPTAQGKTMKCLQKT